MVLNGPGGDPGIAGDFRRGDGVRRTADRQNAKHIKLIEQNAFYTVNVADSRSTLSKIAPKTSL